MIAPPAPLYMCLRQAFVVRKAPSKWIASIFFQSLNGNSSIGYTIWMPALLTRISSRPNRSTVVAIPASTAASSLTSIATPTAVPPARLIWVAVASADCNCRSAIATFAPSVPKRLAISLPMPLAAPVMIATLPSSCPMKRIPVGRSERMSQARGPRASDEVVVDDFAKPQREIGDHVCGRDDFPDWKIRDRRQGVGMKLEGRRSSPRSFEGDVREIEPNQFADTRRAVDMGNDLQQKPRLVERLCHDGLVELAMLVAHRAGRNADAPVIQRADEGVPIDFQARSRELLWKAPEFTSAGDRRVGIEEHGVDIAAQLAAQSDGYHLTRLGVVAKTGTVRHADEFVLDDRLHHFERLWYEALQSIAIGPIGDDHVFPVDEPVRPRWIRRIVQRHCICRPAQHGLIHEWWPSVSSTLGGTALACSRWLPRLLCSLLRRMCARQPPGPPARAKAHWPAQRLHRSAPGSSGAASRRAETHSPWTAPG